MAEWLIAEDGYPNKLGQPMFETRDEEDNPVLVTAPLDKHAYTCFRPCDAHSRSPCTECMLEFNIPPCPEHARKYCVECMERYGRKHDIQLWSLNNVCRFGHAVQTNCLENVPDPAQNLDKATKLMIEFKYEQQRYRPVEGDDPQSNEYLLALVILRNEANSRRQVGRLVDTTKRVIHDNCIEYSGPIDYLDQWSEGTSENDLYNTSDTKLVKFSGDVEFEDKMEF